MTCNNETCEAAYTVAGMIAIVAIVGGTGVNDVGILSSIS